MQKYISTIIICIGLFLTIFGIHIYLNELAFNNNAIKIAASVYDIQKEYNNKNEQIRTTYISYDVNGITYYSKWAKANDKSIGDSIDIYVNKNNVKEIKNNLYNKYVLIIPAMGLSIIVVTIFQIIGKRKKKLNK